MAEPREPMQGVVTTLAAPFADEINAIRAATGAEMTVVPHFSYQLAGAFDVALLREGLQTVAERFDPFTVRTAGFGVFAGAVLYVTVTRSPQLNRLHAAVLAALEPAIVTPTSHGPLYRPDRWVPHVTIERFGEPAGLHHAIAQLPNPSFDWELTVDNLTLLSTARDNSDAFVLPL